MTLSEREWVPHAQIDGPLDDPEIEELVPDLPEAWDVEDGHHLVGDYDFDDFESALAFVNRVGALAEELDHHPDICFGWGYAEITIWTHSVDGLTLNDFIFASRADAKLG